MLLHLSRSVSFLTLSLLLSPLSDFQVNARWADSDDANIECIKGNTVFKVNKDGTWTMESETQLKALNEAGRQELSTQSYTYDAIHDTFEILEAKTNNNGTECIIPKEKMEDKPLASDPLGLKEDHQILVPLECVTIGSIVHLKLKQHCFKPDFEEYFSHSLTYDDAILWKENNVTIESELPLLFKINDPRNSLNVHEDKSDSKHTLKISLKKPVYEELVGESYFSYGEPALYTSVSVSTEKDYKRLGKLAAKLYQPALSEELPQNLETMRSMASNIKDEIDCIDTVVMGLIEKITYLGSWNTPDGSYAPRTLETIINSGYGDCKEYSTCLGAILNKLGYQTKIAFVQRNETYLEEETPLPSLMSFNHAILKVIGPSEKTYWVDPTNIVSMAGGTFPDIADRPALVLDLEIPTYERIPSIDYRHAIAVSDETKTITNEGYVNIEGLMYYAGESSKYLVESLIMLNRSVLKDKIIEELCESGDPIDPFVNLPEELSRKVRPLEIRYSYRDDHIIGHTNLGEIFPLKSKWHKPYIGASLTNEGALYAGHPETLVKKTTFKNLSANNLEALAFSIETPWLNAKRELSVDKEGIVVTEKFEKIKSIISAKDLKSNAYGELKKTLRKYCDGVSIVFSR